MVSDSDMAAIESIRRSIYLVGIIKFEGLIV